MNNTTSLFVGATLGLIIGLEISSQLRRRNKNESHNLIINKLNQIMADLTQLEQEVSENATVTQSAVTLLKGLKAALDAAGTDPVKLKALSDSLSNQTDSLAAAVSENTPAEPTT